MLSDGKDACPRYNVFRLLIGLGCGTTMFSQLRVVKFMSASKRVLVSTCYDMKLAFVYVKDKVSGYNRNVELQACSPRIFLERLAMRSIFNSLSDLLVG